MNRRRRHAQARAIDPAPLRIALVGSVLLVAASLLGAALGAV